MGKGRGDEKDGQVEPQELVAASSGLELVPSQQDMDREDGVAQLSLLNHDDLKKIMDLEMLPLKEYLSGFGLKEIPEKIVENALSGSLLASVKERDVDKMSFTILGEALAFKKLCQRLKKVTQQMEDESAIITRDLVFEGDIHEWHSGCCSLFNQAPMKTHPSLCEQISNLVSLNPQVLYELPNPSITVFRDHVAIQYPRWNKEEIDEKYWELNHAFAPPNLQAWHTDEDNIDFGNIVDIDLIEVHKLDRYQKTCKDVLEHSICCHTLRREPKKGNFYWVTPFHRCCGEARYFKQVADGTITITLRSTDRLGNKVIEFQVVNGSKDLVKHMHHYLEQSQLRRVARINSSD